MLVFENGKFIMITPRLNSILKHITKKSVADIGTDHAYIPIYLAQNKLITHAIACDIKEGPLKIAQKNIEKYGFSDIIETRLGGGFSPLEENEAETAVIAGMGGEMIIKILAENLQKSYSFKEIILQPMNFQAELRKWLTEHNFEVILEDLSKEDFKVYNLIKVKKGNPYKYDGELEYHMPKYLYKNPLFHMLYDKKKREFTKILDGLLSARNKDSALIKKYTNLLKELDTICF